MISYIFKDCYNDDHAMTLKRDIKIGGTHTDIGLFANTKQVGYSNNFMHRWIKHTMD